MNWDDLKCFIAVAETGTMSAASRALSASVSTVGRRLDALEHALGLDLVARNADGAFLTSDGFKLLKKAQRTAEEFQSFERAAASVREGFEKTPIRISATEPLIAEILAPGLIELRKSSSQLIIQLMSSNEPAQLARREADMALRLVRPKGDSLIARRLPDIELACFAAKGFLAGKNPKSLDIASQPLLAFDDSFGDIAEVQWLRESGLGPNVVMKSLSSRALINAAAAGLGVAVAPRFLAMNAGLIEIAASPIPPRQVWLVLHRDLRNNRQMRIVRNWVASTVRAALV